MRINAAKIRALLFPIFLLVVILLAVVLWPHIRSLLDTLDRLGPAAALIFVGVQVIQVVIFVIPGEVVQIAAGYRFGVAGGAALSIAGILIGSAINYAIGRALGEPFVRLVVPRKHRERIERIGQRRGVETGFYLLFLIPGIPKDILGYIAGAASGTFRFVPFLVLSMLGRSVGILGSAMIGASAAAGNSPLAIALLVLAAIVLVVAVRFEDRIEAWLARLLKKRSDTDR